jgi:hypothetical protein
MLSDFSDNGTKFQPLPSVDGTQLNYASDKIPLSKIMNLNRGLPPPHPPTHTYHHHTHTHTHTLRT